MKQADIRDLRDVIKLEIVLEKTLELLDPGKII